MSLPPGVISGHSRAASVSGAIPSASKGRGGAGAGSEIDLISNLCQKISTDLGALGAEWESQSQILDVSQGMSLP